MHNPESVLENKGNDILCDFEVQTDQQISARRPNVVFCQQKREPVE